MVQFWSHMGVCLVEMVETNQSELGGFACFKEKSLAVYFLHSPILDSNLFLNSSSFLCLAVT